MFDQATLEDLFVTPQRNGLTKPKRIRGEGVKMVNMGELFSTRRIHDLPMDRVPCTEKELTTSKLESGDLLFARQSLTLEGAGQSSIFIGDEEDVVFESHLIRCRFDKTRVDPLYFFYFFESKFGKQRVSSIVEQVTAAGIRGSDLIKLPVVSPPIGDQRAIAHILGTIDDKIELNQQMNETLEEISKTIFKSWFIDFEPVRAKMEGRQTGLPDNIDNLFPDKLLKSETGEMPAGWKILPLSECSVEIESGRRPKGGIDKSLTSGIPSIGAESIAPAGEFDFSKVKYVTPEFAQKMKRGKIQNFDVALYKDGGKPGQFIPRVGIYGEGFPFENFFVNEHVFLLRSQVLGQPFLYRLVASQGFLDQLIAKGSAKAAQPGLNRTDVTESNFARPTQDSVDAYNEIIFPILERQFLLGKESEVLSELRDTLLPRLISGELRIPDAEKFFEKAGI